jgi:hypothetical protein
VKIITLTMEEANASVTSVSFYQTTQHPRRLSAIFTLAAVREPEVAHGQLRPN